MPSVTYLRLDGSVPPGSRHPIVNRYDVWKYSCKLFSDNGSSIFHTSISFVAPSDDKT